MEDLITPPLNLLTSDNIILPADKSLILSPKET
jgi:hypothetical protein